jgi:hypothetical protein
MDYKEEFEKGKESARIKNSKQAMISSFLQAVVIAVAIFNEFSFAGKLIIFIILQLILGAVMSSGWMRRKLSAEQENTSHKNAEAFARGIRESKD